MTFDDLPKAMADLQDSVNEIKRLLLTKKNEAQPKLDHIDKLLTIDQAAELLNLTRGSIYQLIHKGKIPYSKRGRLFFSERELRAWIQSGRHQTVEEITEESIKSLKNNP